MKKIIVLAMSLLFISSCKSSKTEDVNSKPTAKKNIMKDKKEVQNFELLLQESHGGYKEQRLLIVNDQKQLTDVYMKLNQIRKPGIPIPAVDFEKNTILALFFGTQQNGAQKYTIVGVSEKNSVLNVLLVVNKPEVATMVITQPSMFLKIPKSNAKEIALKFK